MSLLTRLAGGPPATRSASILSGYLGGLGAGGFTFNGTYHDLNTSLDGSPPLTVGDRFVDRVRQVHETNGVVAAAVVARQWPISQLRFKWRNEAGARPGQMFGNADLSPLERPGSMTRPQWLALAERHVSFAGNSYTRLGADGSLYQLRPDWVDVVLGSAEEPESPAFASDARVLGYAYHAGGRDAGNVPRLLSNLEVIHWAPEPHPLFPWLGESWVTSVLREIEADGQAIDHVSKFFSNAATANMIITAPEGITQRQFEEWVDKFDGDHAGAATAWRNIYLAHGSDAQVVGSSLGDLKMGDLSGGFETRIAVRSRVPSTVLGVREGLGGSALNAGNYDSARRLWADTWLVPSGDSLAAAVERVISPPAPAVELTFDRSRVLLLQEDRTQAASILSTQAGTINTLIVAGFEPDAAATAVVDGDLSSVIGQHTGLPSVQLGEAPAAAIESPTTDDGEGANDE